VQASGVAHYGAEEPTNYRWFWQVLEQP